MKLKKRNIWISGVLAVCLMAQNIVSAEIPSTVTVGTGVLIPMTDIRLNNDAVTRNEYLKELAESINEHSSSSMEIDSNMDSLIKQYIPEVMTGQEENNFVDKREFNQQVSVPEFQELIQKLDPDIRKEYEEWLKNGDEETEERLVQAAEELMEYVKEAQKYAAEMRQQYDSDQTQTSLDSLLSTMGVTEEELLQLLNQLLVEDFADYESFMNQSRDNKTKYIEACLKNGTYEQLIFSDLDESAYINDVFVYAREANDYTDIMYRCSVCGENYSYQKVCSCGKALYSTFYDGKHRDAFNHFTDYGGGFACNSKSDSAVNQCIYCQKIMDMENLRDFLVQENGYWACKNCYFETDGMQSNHIEENMPADYFIHVRTVAVAGIEDDYNITMGEMDSDLKLEPYTMEDIEKLRKLLEQTRGMEYPEDTGTWDQNTYTDFVDDIEKMLDSFGEDIKSGEELLEELLRDSGKDGFIPIERTDEYKDAENRIFGEWPSDRTQWTEEMQKMYEEFMNDYAENEDLQSLLQSETLLNGIDYDTFLKELSQIEAGYTAITENISTTLVVETENSDTHTTGESRTIMGYMKAWVVDVQNGTTVWGPVEDIDGSIPLVWPTTYAGTFAIRRTVDTYYITSSYTTYDLNLKWIVNGTNLPPLYEKTIRRIREDTSGVNERNRKTNPVNDVVVRVVEGNLRVDKTEDYATERIF